jgi:hypothetical protein
MVNLESSCIDLLLMKKSKYFYASIRNHILRLEELNLVVCEKTVLGTDNRILFYLTTPFQICVLYEVEL